MDRHVILIIALMILLVLIGAVSTTGLLSGDREQRYNDLMAAYSFVTSPEEGIITWTTEEAWKEGMNRMIELCPRRRFRKTFCTETMKNCARCCGTSDG